MKLDYRVRDGASAMQTSTRYETFAEECAHLAEQAKTERPRKVLAEMAEAWRKLAQEAERRELYRGPC